MTTIDGDEEFIRRYIDSNSQIKYKSIEVRRFPEEINVVVLVSEDSYQEALDGADIVQAAISADSSVPVFLVVRKTQVVDDSHDSSTTSRVSGVHDARALALVRFVSARSRVSSAENELIYVPDSRASLSAVTAARHHLIFGRRGAGKSALLVEARKSVQAEGSVVSWTNVQTLRSETPQLVFLYAVWDLLRALIGARRNVSPQSALYSNLLELNERVRSLVDAPEVTMADAQRLVPRFQRALADYLQIEGVRAYVFMDDFYYLSRDVQPLVLDMLHGSIREANVWLKVASIRHLTNWWQASPPIGLQSGQDADLIDLDVTLQDPARASRFLEGILVEYARRVGIPTLSRVFNRSALDRLVLASGAVPRDYMVLAMSALGQAQRRENAKVVGVQEVNRAAGDAAASKIQELEEDMAANVGAAERTLTSLDKVRSFCLDNVSFTYFLVSYRDKEQRPQEYSQLADLLDVRLLHLVDSGVSDAHQAGSRFEAYMLDLSQFSGSRLKQGINVLDFEDSHFIARKTRDSGPVRRGGTSRELIAILRVAPTFHLTHLEEHQG